jgi:hypothetical protein
LTTKNKCCCCAEFHRTVRFIAAIAATVSQLYVVLGDGRMLPSTNRERPGRRLGVYTSVTSTRPAVALPPRCDTQLSQHMMTIHLMHPTSLYTLYPLYTL